MSFGEGKFIAMDDLCVTPGASGARPLDEYVAFASIDQLDYLDDFGHCVSYSPRGKNAGDYTVYTGERPYLSAQESTVLRVPWLYQPRLVEIAVYGLARGACTDGVTGAGLQQRVYGPDGRAISDVNALTSINTQGQTPQLQPFEVSTAVDVGTVYIEHYEVWVKSGQGATNGPIGEAADVHRGLELEEDFNANFYTHSVTGAPSVNGLDTQATQVDASSVDHLGSSSSSERVDIAPSIPSPEDVTKVQMGYVQLRGIQIEQRFAPQENQKAHFDANLPVLGETEQALAIRRDNVHRRARPVWVGPVGQAPPAESGWPTGYTERFARAFGGGGEVTLFNADFVLKTDNPRLLILADLAPVYARVSPSFGAAVRPDAVSLPWDAHVVASQLEAGDLSYATAVERGSTAADKRRLSCDHILWSGAGDDPLGYAESLRHANDYPFKEGQLFNADLARITQLLVIDMAVDYDAVAGKPLRLSLKVDPIDGEVVWGNAIIQDLSQLSLVCTGVSIWEVPQ